MVEKERINKYMAEQGLSSRREADELIAAGKVFVNGTRAALGMKVDPEKDRVEIRGKAKMAYAYYAYYKPKGIVTTNAQPGEETIVHHVRFPEDVFPVGRLDKDSEGLVLLTNDRRVTHRLLDPQFDHEKEYVVKVDKRIAETVLNRMRNGMQLEDFKTKPARVTAKSGNSFSIALTEGKKHQIRRMASACGYSVVDLRRVRIGNILLGTLKRDTFRALTDKERQGLLRELGLS